jgi:hypothetical protein
LSALVATTFLGAAEVDGALVELLELVEVVEVVEAAVVVVVGWFDAVELQAASSSAAPQPISAARSPRAARGHRARVDDVPEAF